MREIVVKYNRPERGTMCNGTYTASCEGHSGTGASPEAAIGKLIMRNPDLFGVKVSPGEYQS